MWRNRLLLLNSQLVLIQRKRSSTSSLTWKPQLFFIQPIEQRQLSSDNSASAAILAHCDPAHRMVGRAISRSSLEREVWGLDFGLVKLDTAFPTTRHRRKTKLCYLSAMTRRWAPPTRYTHWRRTVSIMKDFDLVWYDAALSFEIWPLLPLSWSSALSCLQFSIDLHLLQDLTLKSKRSTACKKMNGTLQCTYTVQ